MTPTSDQILSAIERTYPWQSFVSQSGILWGLALAAVVMLIVGFFLTDHLFLRFRILISSLFAVILAVLSAVPFNDTVNLCHRRAAVAVALGDPGTTYTVEGGVYTFQQPSQIIETTLGGKTVTGEIEFAPVKLTENQLQMVVRALNSRTDITLTLRERGN